MCLLERVIFRLSFAAGLSLFFGSTALALGSVAGCGGSSSSSATTNEDGGGGGPLDDGGATDDGSATGNDGGTTTNDSGNVGGGDGGGPAPDYSSAVRIIVEPGDTTAVTKAIQAAKTSVHMTMYLLSSSQVISALIAQKNAGHDVKVLLNQTFPQNSGSNTASYNQLMTAGVNVKWAPAGFTLTHEKCLVIDGTSAWIMTMNATQTSPTDNREFLAVDTDPADVAEAEAIFQADFANQALVPSGKLVVAPDNARAKLVALIASAKATVDVEAEEMSDSSIVGALTGVADRGVKVRIVIADGSSSSSQQQAVAQLKQHGVKVVATTTPYIHAKSIVVDNAAAYVGSENFSSGSLLHNRELGVLTNAVAEVAKITQATNTDFAAGTPQ
jgi:cardiolipin synthase